MVAIAPILIAQKNTKEDLQPISNNIPLVHEVVPSNKTTQPPKTSIQWQKGMRAIYQGTDWVIGTLGSATAKIVRNGFELWVDIPELAIATDTKYVLPEIKVREFF